MRIDIQFGKFELPGIVDAARLAEEVGFDTLWVGENIHDPFVGLALAARSTSRIELGTAVSLAFVRTPTSLAYSAWDIQQLSNGRFLFGLGTQVKAHIERRFGVPWERPITRLSETVGAMRACWQAWQNRGPLKYSGQYLNLSLMPPYFSPDPLPDGQDRIPVYLAGLGDAMSRLAGRIADGYHIHPLHTPRYLKERLIPAVEAGLDKRGRKREEISLSTAVFAATGNNKQELRGQVDQVREHIAFYASTPNYQPLLELEGWPELGHRLRELIRQGLWDKLKDEISDDMVEAMAVVDSPQNLGKAIRDRYESVIERVSLYDLPWSLEDGAHWQKFISEFK